MTEVKKYDQVEMATEKLIPYANNSRTHDEKQIKEIAASMKEWGFTNPVLVDEENMIIAGHGRVMAAELLGLETVPCVVLEGLTDAQKKAYVIADNKIALNAGWDFEVLQNELEALSDLDYEIDLLGFDSAEIDTLFPDEESPRQKAESEKPKEHLVVTSCISEHEQEKLYTELKNKGYQVKVMD